MLQETALAFVLGWSVLLEDQRISVFDNVGTFEDSNGSSLELPNSVLLPVTILFVVLLRSHSFGEDFPPDSTRFTNPGLFKLRFQ